MITYNLPKFNEISKEFEKILLNNNIDIEDAEEIIAPDIINLLTEQLVCFLETVDKFVSLPCPKCGKTHLVPMQSCYNRNIIFKVHNLLINFQITVPRLKCNNCGATHAVLPSFCVPFKQFSNQAILEIVALADETSTQDVADKLDIDPKQVRRFVNIVRDSKNNILFLYQMYPSEFKHKIDKDSNINIIIKSLSLQFDEIYFREFKSIFLYIKNKRNIYIDCKYYHFKITQKHSYY